jgi:hypothetical protein
VSAFLETGRTQWYNYFSLGATFAFQGTFWIFLISGVDITKQFKPEYSRSEFSAKI